MLDFKESALAVVDGPRYIVIDTETTGLSNDARVVQLSAVDVTIPLQSAKKGEMIYDGNVRAIDMLLNPECAIPSRASRIHGIYDEDVEDSPTFSHRAHEIAEFFEGAVLIGHNVSFDLARLEYEFERAGVPWTRPECICTLALARQFYDFPNNKLTTITDTLGIPHHPHEALSDALATFQFLHVIVASGKNVPGVTDRPDTFALEPELRPGEEYYEPDFLTGHPLGQLNRMGDDLSGAHLEEGWQQTEGWREEIQSSSPHSRHKPDPEQPTARTIIVLKEPQGNVASWFWMILISFLIGFVTVYVFTI
ncbi:3'-5' exonuclease [Falsiruegeria mediterranea]